ncbi:MAG: ABC transporter substrate-binding protein [Bacteroidales bacterium]|nr:ABC transporter substrate-binding protein [Bacteroidales bacterium]
MLQRKRPLAALWLATWLVWACGAPAERPQGGMEYAQWFSITEEGSVVVFSPTGAAPDTLVPPLERMVCMSSSYVGFLEAIGADDAVVGVSGKAYLGNARVQASAREVGFDAALDYEAILRARPDVLLTYSVGAVEPPYLAKLRDLGIRPVVLSEHLESHPLARAEYVKLFGALTGRQAAADSVFSAVRDRYLSLVQSSVRRKVLINIPYADIWYIPGGDNYMTRMVQDAGGELLGSVPGRQDSGTIGLEQAYAYAKEADVWLNPGWCRTREQLRSVHPLFPDFPVLERAVWNNTLQETPGGGNRFWETGPVHPDWILEDLVHLFSGDTHAPMHYFLPVE